MNYYSRHIGDYLRDTSHLSLLEHGIYTRLLDVYYTLERPIENTGIGRRIGIRTDQELEALLIVLSEFFVEDKEKGIWTQPRCEREIAAFHDKQGKAKASAALRWKNTERNATAMPTHSEGNAPNNQEPITNNQREKTPSVSRARRCPVDFAVAPEDLASMAAECPGLHLERETALFRDWEFKTARSDWAAAWRTWMRKAHKEERRPRNVVSFRERDEAPPPRGTPSSPGVSWT